ncbi:GspH/FimT family pseudopilin [Aquipseudomonas ullengensis]|uniref:Type II secretion system protein H n=1 Tax=Aquipseudomonas ullengensis TaxID=2759166 RepID=A0A7W4LP79_9GAMM|nr:GspH/FimT family pseudopilin [Pseudomonas ullengensis]MBB2496768.1 GspH/FimT family pseudopilin [Pseudomonas ullengensis]
MTGYRGVRGFTLIEMMVVLVLLVIAISIAIPSVTSMIRNQSVTTASDELYGLLQYARGEAVTRGQRVSITATGSTAWTGTLDVQANRDGSATTLRHYESLDKPEITASAVGAAISALDFYANGSSSSATTITLCYDGDTTVSGKVISVARSGQISAPERVSCE